MHCHQLFYALFVAAGAVQASFEPRTYPKQFAKCHAVNRADNTLAEIEISYVEVNPDAKTTLLMVHGWPGLWSTWSKQIQEFQKDYHIIAPDLRGFGASTHPGDTKGSSHMGDLAGDLTCVLAHAKVESAVCIGHDWGAQTCYEATRMRPDVFKAAVGVTIPYIPNAGGFAPVSEFIPVLPRLAYQLFFDHQTSAAGTELDADVRRTIRATLRTVDSPPPDAFLTSKESFLQGWKDVPDISPVPFFTADEEDYFVEQYSIQGFENTLGFYTNENRFASWQLAQNQGNFTISQPVLSVLALDDPVADWMVASQLLKSAEFIIHLTVKPVHGAHWIQLESPVEVNAAIRKWLNDIGLGVSKQHVPDEL